MMRGAVALLLLLLGALLLSAVGCSDDEKRYDQAIGVLIDVSGTYADEKKETVKVIKREILPAMIPGDTLLVIRIDSESYDQENVEALLTLDKRPSHANAQKLAVARKLDAFAARPSGSRYTDIPGAMMLASEYLSEVNAGSSVLLLFSDLKEELPAGSKRNLAENELADTRVAAMNVKRLGHDTSDPAIFRKRLASWGQRVTNAGAIEWRTFMDATKLATYLSEIR